MPNESKEATTETSAPVAEKEKAEEMKTLPALILAAILFLSLASCCTTRVRAIVDRSGRLVTVAEIQGDGPVTVTYTNAYNRVTFSATLSHSTPEAAFFTGFDAMWVNIGTAVASSFAAFFAPATAAKL